MSLGRRRRRCWARRGRGKGGERGEMDDDDSCSLLHFFRDFLIPGEAGRRALVL